jgi:hypothetical protein
MGNKESKKIKLLERIKEYRNEILEDFPHLDNENPATLGAVMEIFICREVYGPMKGLTDDAELDDCMDIDSRGDRMIDIAIAADNELNLYESKYRDKPSASFNKDWIEKILGVEDLLQDKEKISKLPSYARDKLEDFFANPYKQKILNVHLCTTTTPKTEIINDFAARCAKSSKRIKEFEVNYHLYTANDIWTHYERSSPHTPLKAVELKKKDLETGKDRAHLISGSFKDIWLLSVSGNEVVDWVSKNPNLFHDNIRGFKGRTSVNSAMLKTIDQEPEQFITFNNGITACTSDIKDENGMFTFEKFQIINGCQTASTLHDYSKKAYKYDKSNVRGDKEKINNLRKLRVLVRVVSLDTAKQDGIKEKLIKANNTQTPVKNSDFRSTDPVQRELDRFINSERSLSYKKKKISYSIKSSRLQKKANTKVLKLTELAEDVFCFEQEPYTCSGSTVQLYDAENTVNKTGNYWLIFGENKQESLKLSPTRMKNLVAISFIANHIRDLRKTKIKGLDKDSDKYNIYYLRRHYISLVGEALRNHLSKTEYQKFLDKCYKANIFEDTKYDSFFSSIIQSCYDAIEFAYEVKRKSSGGGSPNIRNFSRNRPDYEDIKNRFLERDATEKCMQDLQKIL